jgi:hypothetical protein
VVGFPDGSCQPLLHVLGGYVSYMVVTRFRMAPAWAVRPIHLDLCSSLLAGLLFTAARSPDGGVGTFNFDTSPPAEASLPVTVAGLNAS